MSRQQPGRPGRGRGLTLDIDGQTLYVGTSLGAAVFPEHGETDVKLIAHADTAMCRAKEAGKAAGDSAKEKVLDKFKELLGGQK